MKMTDALMGVQDGRCFYCGEEFSGPARPGSSAAARRWTRDHVLPKSRGFTLHNNFILACRRCNRDKGCQQPTPAEITRAYVTMQKAVRLMRIGNGDVPDGWTLDSTVTALPKVHSKPMTWWERFFAFAAHHASRVRSRAQA